MLRQLAIIFGFGLVVIFGFWFWYQEGVTKPLAPEAKEEIVFIIERGDRFLDIAENLEKQGLIVDKRFFILYIVFQRQHTKLQAGHYLLSPAMSIQEIAQKIVAGDIMQERVTIIEGWDLRDIALHLEEKNLFSSQELFEITGYPPVDYPNVDIFAKDFSQEFDFLKDKPREASLEGYIFPDTYNIVIGENAEDFVKKALQNFGRKLTPELRAEIKRQGKSIFDIIIMASMIEKEVVTAEDKRLVSGILWKRLEAGLPLQVDATISYITGRQTTKISKKETEIDSPYNTYKYLGLPKGPIANPGLESITAAIYPESSPYWYYLSTPEGETIFSRTLEEHNAAKMKYLR